MLLELTDGRPAPIEAAAFARRTGWDAKPEGLCKGPVCVPAPDVRTADDRLDPAVLQSRLGMPLVVDEANGVAALGPATLGRALDTAELPELVLPDADGNPFDLASLHGRKVLLVAWASW